MNQKKIASPKYPLQKDTDAHTVAQHTSQEPTIKQLLLKAIDIHKYRLSPRSIQGYQSVIDVFCEKNKDLNACQLNTYKIIEYSDKLTALAYKGKTVNFHISTLKTLFNVLIIRGLLKSDNPCTNVPRLKSVSVGYDYFPTNIVIFLAKNIPQIDPQVWLAAQFIYYCCLRPKQELRQLKISDINLEAKKITVCSENSKNGKRQQVSIPDEFVEILYKSGINNYPINYYVFGKKGVPSNFALGKNNLSARHQKILKKLGLDTKFYKLYSWKHTAAYNAVMANIPIKMIQLQLRHHAIAQTDVYLQRMGINASSQFYSGFKMVY